MSGPVLLLDTCSLLFRAFWALPDLCTSDGEPTGGTFGLCVLLLKLVRERAPSGLAFAMDLPLPTFRHRAWEGYKAGRPRAPTPLQRELARLPELLAAIGAPVLGVPGFEADDVLATLARHHARAGREVWVVSGDRDLFQVVDEKVRVLFLGQRGREPVEMDLAAVRARYGVPARQLPTWTALVGDPSDNLAGLEGVGPRTATRWVAAHGTLEAILDHADELRPASLAARARAEAERLLRDEALATLRDDLDLGPGPYVAPFPAGPDRAALRGLFLRLEFKSLASAIA